MENGSNNKTAVLVGDIGGTNSRLSIVKMTSVNKNKIIKLKYRNMRIKSNI